jgi:hypothetical protein
LYYERRYLRRWCTLPWFLIFVDTYVYPLDYRAHQMPERSRATVVAMWLMVSISDHQSLQSDWHRLANTRETLQCLTKYVTLILQLQSSRLPSYCSWVPIANVRTVDVTARNSPYTPVEPRIIFTQELEPTLFWIAITTSSLAYYSSATNVLLSSLTAPKVICAITNLRTIATHYVDIRISR